MPKKFGRYELQDLLGRGGMGEVYRAFDTVRDRTVALKLLSKHLAQDEAFKTRFRRESRMVAKLNEPHIIPIHDFGEIDDQLFLDMRLVDGADLGTVLENGGALEAELAVNVISQVASALDAAHDSGLVHRDVKPSNVLLTGLGDDRGGQPFAYLVDFGVARASGQDGTALTATTDTIGTIAYMSPERIGGESGDRSTDIYALACVLYEVLTGRKPFDGELFAIMYAHMHTDAAKVSTLAPSAPPGLDQVVARGMAKKPQDRYSTAGEFAHAARAALRAAPGVAPPQAGQASLAQAPSPSPVWSPPPLAPRPTEAPAWTGQPHQLPVPPPGPGLQPAAGSPSRTSRRRAVLAGSIALVLIAVSAVVVIVMRSGHKAPTAKGGPGSSSPVPGGGPLTLKTGGATTPTVDWAHFASFSNLVGAKNGETGKAFKGGACTLSEPTDTKVVGIADVVKCTLPGVALEVYVARFSTEKAVHTYTESLTDAHSFAEKAWTMAGGTRGLEFVSPASATDVNIVSTFCALPTYLVQFFAADKTKVDEKSVLDNYWGAATFPDVVPASCDGTFTHALPQLDSAAAVPAKGAEDLGQSGVNVLLTGEDSTRTPIAVTVPGGFEVMVLAQKGQVTFWSWQSTAKALSKVGASTYPYDLAKVGPPKATGAAMVLTGMLHATYIVTGTFSGDGSGNSVAYTTGAKGWGAVKVAPTTKLVPSGQGVALGGAGLEDEYKFFAGALEAASCSSTLPIAKCTGQSRVLKFWVWNSTLSQFTLDSTGGLKK